MLEFHFSTFLTFDNALVSNLSIQWGIPVCVGVCFKG